MTRKPFPISDNHDFKAWKVQNPNAEKLLFKIILRWRVSNARHRELPGKWVANSLDFWAKDAELSRDQTKRALRVLGLDGLVVRARGRFAGPNVHPFLQPTALALTYIGRPGDLERLLASLAPPAAPTVAPTPAPTAAPIGAPTDYTSPSIPSKFSKPSTPTDAHAHAQGKGKEGLGGKEKKKLILNPKPADQETEDVDELIAAAKAKTKEAKAKKLLEKFPILKGAHEKFVKHPYQMHGGTWATWSPDLIAKKYAAYEAFVENWYTGKKGKAYKPLSHDDAEFNLDLDSIPDFDEVWAAKGKKK